MDKFVKTEKLLKLNECDRKVLLNYSNICIETGLRIVPEVTADNNERSDY